MAFCSRCGAPTTPSMLYCSACGASLAPVTGPTTAPVAPPAWAPAPAAAPRGPVGQTREPAMAVVLAIVTLGIYGLYYWWVTSREVDEYARKPGHAHNLVRIGTILSIVGGVVLLFTFISFLGSMIASGIRGNEPTPEEVLAIVGGAIGGLLLGGLASLAGGIMRLVGKYRAWQTIEEDERRRGLGSPLSSGLMLALTLIGWFVSPFGWILSLVVLYMTQEHLNETWNAAR